MVGPGPETLGHISLASLSPSGVLWVIFLNRHADMALTSLFRSSSKLLLAGRQCLGRCLIGGDKLSCLGESMLVNG